MPATRPADRQRPNDSRAPNLAAEKRPLAPTGAGEPLARDVCICAGFLGRLHDALFTRADGRRPISEARSIEVEGVTIPARTRRANGQRRPKNFAGGGPLQAIEEKPHHFGRRVGTVCIRVRSAGVTSGPGMADTLDEPVLQGRCTVSVRYDGSCIRAAVSENAFLPRMM